MKNYDYKSKMNKNRKRLAKRVGSIALVTTLAMSTPVATNVISETGFKNVLNTSVVEAATDNLLEFDDILTYAENFHSEEYEETRHIIYGSASNQLTFDDKQAFTLVVQLPDELSYLLDDSYVLDNLKGNGGDPNTYGKFVLTGTIVDKNGDQRSISRDTENILDYVSVNKNTNSIEYDLYQFFEDNELDMEEGLRHYSFEAPIVVKDEAPLYNGTYTFTLAGIAEGSGVDLSNVNGTYTVDLEISDSEDPPEVPEVDKTDLESELDAIKAENLSEDDYTDASWTAFQEALSAAEAALADEDATQDEIDNTLAALTDAREGLEEAEEPADPAPEVDKTDLESELDAIKAEDLSEDDYTDASWTTFQEALSAAEAVLADEDATQDETDDALAALTEARSGLETVDEPTPEPEVDKTDLESELAAIKAEDLSEDDYTETSWTAFQEALSAAEAALADEDATQDEIDDALVALTAARDGLKEENEESPNLDPEPSFDKSDLETMLAEIAAANLSETDFTDASWKAFQEALSVAEAILADKDAIQDEIDNALATLIMAYEGLEKVKELIPENSDEDEVIVDVDSDDDNTLPDTATSTFNWLIGGFIAMLAGVAGLFTRRGKKNSKNSVK